jgi:hypothetical protein
MNTMDCELLERRWGRIESMWNSKVQQESGFGRLVLGKPSPSMVFEIPQQLAGRADVPSRY